MGHIIKYPQGLPVYPGFHTAASVLRYPGAPLDGVPVPPSPGDVARAMRYKAIILDYTKSGPIDCEHNNQSSRMLAEATVYEQKVLASYTGAQPGGGEPTSSGPPAWAIAMQHSIETSLSTLQNQVNSTLANLQSQINAIQTSVSTLENQVKIVQNGLVAVQTSARQNHTTAIQGGVASLGTQVKAMQNVLTDVQFSTKRAEFRVMNDISVRLDSRALQPLPNAAGKLSPNGQKPITSTEHLWRLSGSDVDLWISHYGIPVAPDAGHPVKLTALRTFLGVL